MIPRSSADFDIAIICALPVEFDAVETLFDEYYDSATYEKQHGDTNFYRTGKIHQHNVVLACLPEMGKRSAAGVASSLQCTFANIYLTLLVGICGGVPYLPAKARNTGETELILGDVIISSSFVEYDFGKQYPDRFQPRHGLIDTIGRDRRIRTLLAALRTSQLQNEFQQKLSSHLVHLQDSDQRWDYPGVEHDKLYDASYRHKHHIPGPRAKCVCDTCESSRDPVCDEAIESDCIELGCNGKLANRKRLSSCDSSPQIHIGILGSGDTVMKSGEHRDGLAKTAKIIGFEMEGAGVCDSVPCLIIKAICDYADSHKNKIWQQYAAATAASCCKAFLEILPKTIHKSASLFAEDGGPAFEVAVNGDSILNNRTAKKVSSTATPEEFGSTSLDGASDAQDDYQWDFTSIASEINDMGHHLDALGKELYRIKANIANPLVKSVLISGVTQAVKSNPQTPRSSQGIESFRVSYYDTRFGTIIYRTWIDRKTIIAAKDGDICTHYKTTTSFIFHPASWLIRIGFKYGLEAMITKSQAGWQYRILPVRSVPEDALIFEFCKLGNVDAVRELFRRGDASVLDVDSLGWRPLHFATRNGHFELAKYLIMQGADKEASGFHPKLLPAITIRMNDEVMNMLSLFDDCIDLSEPTSLGWEILGLLYLQGFYVEDHVLHDVLAFFLRKYRVETLGRCYDVPIQSVLKCAVYLSETDSVRLLLDFNAHARSVDTLDIPFDFTFTYRRFKPLAFDVFQAPHTSTDILRHLMDKGADVHGLYDGETPTTVSLYFSGLFLYWRDRLQAIYQERGESITLETWKTYILEQSDWHPDALQILFGLRKARTYTLGYTNMLYDTFLAWKNTTYTLP